MNPLAIAAGMLVIVISLVLIGDVSTWFVQGQQIQIIYVGIVIFAGMILVGVFHGR